MVYCLWVGPFRDKRFKELADDYKKRLDRLWPVTIVEMPEKTKDILKWCEARKGKGKFISLDAHGKNMDSQQFTQWVTQSSQELYLWVWGADGPPAELPKGLFQSVSLSPMTYPHELARVLLMEQLYRAGATLKGHPYPR
jgi:23S rRNA (pseudouridine1915-N3)-methyltransferase